MAKKKNIKKKDILSWYVNYVLENNKDPESVYKFCKLKHVNIEESSFYKYFTSFESIKASVFTTFYENTLVLLEKSEEYSNFDARNKLLSFYYTFFEILTANRSYVVYALDSQKHTLETLKTLRGLRTQFKNFIDELEIETLDLKKDNFKKLQRNAIGESAWIQLLVTLKFWIEDTSPSFEKTEIFIEKSVKASFDILDITPVKSVIDLGKFMFKEKMMMS